MPRKNYYEVLGVPRTATEDEIKRRYRQLVRLHHPDVAQDKAAAKDAFLQITEAYQTLISPDRRLIYDATIDMPSFRPGPQPGPARPRTAQGTSSAGASQARRRQAQQRQTQSAQPNRAAEIQRWMAEARKGFTQSQYRSAIYACKEALKLDSRSAEAHTILGDIYRIQGRTDEAIAMYTLAVQLDPRNADVQAKLDRLVRKEKVQTVDGQGAGPDRRAALKMGLALTIGSISLVVLLLVSIFPGQPVPWLQEHITFIGKWSWNLLIAISAAGMLIGLMLSLTDTVQPLDDELVFHSVRAVGSNPISYPVGLLLVVMSLFNFYVAAGVYFLIGWTQESVSRSVVKALGATLALVIIASIAYDPGRTQVFYFGGNIVFPAMLLGWTIGDLFRPSW